MSYQSVTEVRPYANVDYPYLLWEGILNVNGKIVFTTIQPSQTTARNACHEIEEKYYLKPKSNRKSPHSPPAEPTAKLETSQQCQAQVFCYAPNCHCSRGSRILTDGGFVLPDTESNRRQYGIPTLAEESSLSTKASETSSSFRKASPEVDNFGDHRQWIINNRMVTVYKDAKDEALIVSTKAKNGDVVGVRIVIDDSEPYKVEEVSLKI